jgi:hypothetical protein
MSSSKLQLAIARGFEPGGDLKEELDKLDDYTVESPEDAEAICQALSKLPLPPEESERIVPPLEPLARLFK